MRPIKTWLFILRQSFTAGKDNLEIPRKGRRRECKTKELSMWACPGCAERNALAIPDRYLDTQNHPIAGLADGIN